MRFAAVLRGLGPIDVKSIRRDSMLPWLILLPLGLALLMRWGVPSVAARLAERFQFALPPYYPLIASFLVLIGPTIAGVVVGFLLLDQRDDGTLHALQVTPLTLGGYLTYRVAAPMLVSVVITLAVVPLSGLASIGVFPLLVVALAAAPMAPIFALFLGGFAQNKVQGFALMKAAGVLNWPPIVAYFVSGPWQSAFGVVPTYWPVKLFWTLHAAERGGWIYFVVGVAYQLALLLLLLRRFEQVSYR